MKKLKLYYIFDTFFRLLIFFLILFVWIRYSIRTLWLSLVISAIATLLLDFCLKLLKDKKKKKNKFISDQKEKIEKCINSLVFDDDKNVIEFFYKLANSKHTATKKTSYVLISHPNKKIVLIKHN